MVGLSIIQFISRIHSFTFPYRFRELKLPYTQPYPQLILSFTPSLGNDLSMPCIYYSIRSNQRTCKSVCTCKSLLV